MITIEGVGDDIIAIRGDWTEEIYVLGEEDGSLTLSNGIVLRYSLTDELEDGCWRFYIERQPDRSVVIKAPVDDEYSDTAEIADSDDIRWIRHDATGRVIKR